MENTTRIIVNRAESTTGYYRVEVKMRWGIFSWWKPIEEYLNAPVHAFNPVLLKYEDAKRFAVLMKDPVGLEAFNKRQFSLMEADEKTEFKPKLYPVYDEVF